MPLFFLAIIGLIVTLTNDNHIYAKVGVFLVLALLTFVKRPPGGGNRQGPHNPRRRQPKSLTRVILFLLFLTWDTAAQAQILPKVAEASVSAGPSAFPMVAETLTSVIRPVARAAQPLSGFIAGVNPAQSDPQSSATQSRQLSPHGVPHAVPEDQESTCMFSLRRLGCPPEQLDRVKDLERIDLERMASKSTVLDATIPSGRMRSRTERVMIGRTEIRRASPTIPSPVNASTLDTELLDALVEFCQNQGLGDLLNLLEPWINSYSHAYAQDIRQQVFLAIYEEVCHPNQFGGPNATEWLNNLPNGDIKSALFKIINSAKSEVMRWDRQLKRNKSHSLSGTIHTDGSIDLNPIANIPDTAADPEQKVIAIDLLRKTFSALKQDQQVIVILLDNGYKRKEIAYVLGAPSANAIDKRVQRIRDRLKEDADVGVKTSLSR